MFDTSLVWLTLGVLFGGSVGLGFAGAAVHHGWAGAIETLVLCLFANWLRDVARWRIRRWTTRENGEDRASWLGALRGVVFGSTRSSLRALAIPPAGYAWAHTVDELPRVAAIAVPLVILAGLVWAVRHEGFRNLHSVRFPTNLGQWRTLRARLHLPSVGHLFWLSLIPLWPAPTASIDAVLQGTRALQPAFPRLHTLAWLDPAERGVRNAFGARRALLLGAEENAPADVFLLRVAFTHDGYPTRILGAYNLTQTASVEEADLSVWQRWAAWSIRHDGLVQSIEMADLRGETPGRGEGWNALKRAQRALSNRQGTGVWRGVGRSGLKLRQPSQRLELELGDGGLRATLDAVRLEVDLGRVPTQAQLADIAEYVATATPLPGSLVPWTVDRLRAMPWIGSEGMQKVKGWAFRASEQLEELEHQVVGIDADEVIAEELGDVLETLPLAMPGEIPNWPPAPLEPVLKPAMAGEGRWVSLAADVVAAGTPGTPSPFVFTFIRVDEQRGYIQTSITLWDPRQLELHIVAGTEEPQSMTGELGTGLIPREPPVLGKLVAAFNGAFQAMHGEFGMMENGRVQLPPKPFAATVATYPDGRTGFGTWPKDTPIPADMVSLRQNMTPLVVDGRFNPYKRAWWGGVPEGWTEESRTVRSGLCLTQEGFIAYFYSPGIDPEGLGRAMIQARCAYGLHLDMNAGHTGFEFYRVAPLGQLPALDKPLDRLWEARGRVTGLEELEFISRLMVRKMPLMNFPRYIHLTSRDFFYLTRRTLLPGPAVPPLIEGEPNDGKWRISDPADVWPHVVARTGLHAPGDGQEPPFFLITRIDPKQLRRVASAEQATLGISWPRLGQVAGSGTDETSTAPLPGAQPGGPSVAPGQGGAAGDVASAPNAAGVRAMWLTGKQFRASVEAPPTGDQPLGMGRAQATPTSSAVCVDEDGLLVLMRREGAKGSDPRALNLVVERMRCRDTMYLDHVPHVAVTTEERALLADNRAAPRSPLGAASQSDVSWFARDTMLGVQRIFEQTPILDPSGWAILQKQRVPYLGRSAAPTPN